MYSWEEWVVIHLGSGVIDGLLATCRCYVFGGDTFYNYLTLFSSIATLYLFSEGIIRDASY